jgi:hypothetical protein
LAKGADHVADDLRPAEEFGQRPDVMSHFGYFVLGRFDAWDLVHHRLDPRLVAARGDEGNVKLTQIFANETSRVA